MWTLKVLGLGAVVLTVSAELLAWLLRRSRRDRRLHEVLFFPCEEACVEHVFSPDAAVPCQCPLLHGVDTSFCRLLRHLLAARSRLDVCVFAFSNMDLCRALLLLQARGVALRVLADHDYTLISGSQIGVLRRAGISVRCDATAVHMHHKFALVDGRRLLTGSLNWTLGALHHNKENVLVTEEPGLVRPFLHEFQRLWDLNDPALPGAARLPSVHALGERGRGDYHALGEGGRGRGG